MTNTPPSWADRPVMIEVWARDTGTPGLVINRDTEGWWITHERSGRLVVSDPFDTLEEAERFATRLGGIPLDTDWTAEKTPETTPAFVAALKRAREWPEELRP